MSPRHQLAGPPSTDFSLSTRRRDGLVVVQVSGTIDRSCRSLFRWELDELLTESLTRVEIDLAGVDRMDFAGIGELLSFVQALERKRARATLVNVGDDLLQLFYQADVIHVFEVEANLTARVVREARPPVLAASA